ncbi:unnamed protein product [Brachionus calyciflorus]|uniref:Torsin-1A-interacting protein 1/2 AAA+ activator domain-containing protein n=1 Tax=Brachionus calyciflorus TaxID=104777 RepID=A0A813UWB7_9BILA|nr:unnamed protein product [Brachionus calyciflorus]
MSEDYLNNLKKTTVRKDRKSLNKSDFDKIEFENMNDEIDSEINPKENPLQLNFSLLKNEPKEINNNLHNDVDESSSDSCDEETSDRLEHDTQDNENSIEEIHEEKLPIETKIETCLNGPINKDFLNSPNKTPTPTIVLKTGNISFIKSLRPFILNFGFIVIIIGIAFSILQTNSSSKKTLKKNVIKFDLIDQLREKYPNQTHSFWTNIESSFKHSVLESKDPSIVLIVYEPETQNVYKKIIMDILGHLNKIEKFSYDLAKIIIDPENDERLNKLIKESKIDETKYYIDSKLDKNFKSGKKLALVENIQILPAHPMLLFYTYGDDLNSAKYPGVLIFMSLKLEENLNSDLRSNYLKSSRKLTKFAEDYMFNLWSKYIKEDQLRPLFTRIANNVVLLNLE